MNTFKAGDTVIVKDGMRRAGKKGIVQHSDKSITTVKFDDNNDNTVEPVWTSHLQKTTSK